MFKPSAPKISMPAVWIVAIVVVAIAAVAGNGRLRAQNRSAAAGHVEAVALQAPAPSANQRRQVRAHLDALPLAFEANQGQTDPQVKYIARGNGYKLFLTSSQAIMTLPSGKRFSEVRDMMLNKRRGPAAVKALLKKRALKSQGKAAAAVLRMNLVGANPHALLTAEDLQSGKVNYFMGNEPSKWHSNIPLYGRVNYKNLYPGVDLVFHGASERLEFDYLVSPGADAATIGLGFQGAESVRTDETGNLVLATTSGPVRLNKPIAYQLRNGNRQLVDASYVVKGQKVAFELGPYDHNRELVIDPTVTYSTYFGGGSADYGISIAVDKNGNAFVAGATDSSSIPGDSAGAVGFDTFVTEISPSGTLVFSTIFGGSQDDFPGGIAVDSLGIYLAGTTDSSDFPVTAGAAQTTFMGGVASGNNDAYAIKLALNGSSISWGTFIAGSDSDSGLGIAVDSVHNVYVVGETFSTNIGGVVGGINHLPNGGALNLGNNNLDDDGYIVKLNATGSAYAVASYLGGRSGDLATGVALDGSGNIYVAGETISPDLPVTANVVQSTCGSDGNCNASASSALDDAFVVSIKASLLGYNYVTYYGGNNVDDAFAIKADSGGNAFITGTTASSDFLTTASAFQSALAGTQNAFVVELNSTGSSAAYSSYFGGDGSDFGLAIALDGSDNVFLTGQTTSSSGSFPLVNPTQADGSGSSDAFVSVLGISQGHLLFSTFLGGGGDEDQFAGGIAVDSAQKIYVTGDTDSGNGSTAVFPTTSGALDTTYGGGTCVDSVGNNVPCPDAFVAAYSSATAKDFTISATALSPSTVSPGGSATSTVTVTPLNGYTGTVNLTCGVTGGGSPQPQCSLNPTSGNSSTLTVTTTGKVAAMFSSPSLWYAMWLPVVGLSLLGMRLSTADSRRKKLQGLLLIGVLMVGLFLLPACGGGGGGGGSGCTGCTPAGSYTVTVTGTDSVSAALTHSTTPSPTLNVN